MNKIIEVKAEDFKPGDYIVTNFMYRDDKIDKDVPVECRAKVKRDVLLLEPANQRFVLNPVSIFI